MSESTAVILRAEGISKEFGITRALEDVTVSFAAGEVHALMGENGAGKSTLGKVIAGLHRADTGTVTIFSADGAANALRPGSIRSAFEAGVRIVHQELAQCANLSVAENLCLHDVPRTRLGTVDGAEMRRRARVLLAELEPGIDVDTPLGRLSPGHRQIVQIASALAEGKDGHAARVIVFDEPTSSLTITEVDRLLAIIRGLAQRGITCIYVSHRMSEIFAVCDRVTVLRDGKCVATSIVAEIDESGLVEQMVGRKVPAVVRRSRPPGDGAAALRVRDLSSPGRIQGVSLEVGRGEIVGLGGLVGAGRSELLDAIFGLDAEASGTVECAGVVLMCGGAHRGARASIAAGMGYVPEDRRLQGLFFQLGVGENIVEPVMGRLATVMGVRRMRAERAVVVDRVREFEIRAAGMEVPPGALSGGNQQKLLLARWLGQDTKVILLDEPTRGIDVGTKAQIYRLVRQAAERGLGVLLVSSEMPELLALSDRIIVLSEGRMTGELREEGEITQARILTLATAGH